MEFSVASIKFLQDRNKTLTSGMEHPPPLILILVKAEYLITSARNGNLEVRDIFLKAKQGYTVRKMETDKLTYCIMISEHIQFSNKKKFWYGMTAYTDPFLATVSAIMHHKMTISFLDLAVTDDSRTVVFKLCSAKVSQGFHKVLTKTCVSYVFVIIFSNFL
jgi:hypothetical protein